MSIDQNDSGEVGEADVMLAQALAQAVREVGRNLATDPRRVQGMVSDVLGVESRTRRAEIDAVVLAAEESVPEDLLADRIDVETALERLHGRGLDAGVAVFAVEVWRYALGMLEADAQPPTLSNSLEFSTRPAITDAAPPEIVADRPRPETIVDFAPPVTAEFARVVGDGSPQPLDAARREDSKPTWLFVAAAVAVLALIAGIVLATRGGDDETAAEPVSTSVAATTTEAATTTTPTSTTVATMETVFTAETTPLGEMTRTWSIEGGTLISTLAFNNTTAADTTGRYYEVVPKSLAATADLITSTTQSILIKNDPVVAWDLTIPAHQTLEVEYQIDVADNATSVELEKWKTEQATEAAAFKVEIETTPVLTLQTPPILHIPAPTTDINGTVSPANAIVSMAGTPITVKADGTWSINVGPMPAGPANAYTITATNAYGFLPVSVSGVIFVETAPVETDPPQTATTAPRPPNPGTPTTTTTTMPYVPPPGGGTTTTTVYVPPPPTNSPPVKKFDPTYTAATPCEFTQEFWYVYVIQAFTDPDGDPMYVSSASTGTGSASPDPNGLRWTEPYANFVGQAGVSFVVSDGRGGSTSGYLTITVNAGDPSC